MNCQSCSGKAIIAVEKPLCKEHFVEYFEKKVVATIRNFNLLGKNDKVIVGSSGGKDSTTVLYILKKYFGKIEALAIDEGIPGYRNVTLDDLRRFCSSYDIPLHIYSYKEEFGFTITDALKLRKDVTPCNMCGTLRRYLLNTKARGFSKIATGHNLDDEAQSIMMNLMKAQLPLLSRLGPSTGNLADANFVSRVKPLYFCSEKEVATYAIIKQFGIKFAQCPHSVKSFRAFVRDTLNDYEAEHKGAKMHLARSFLEMLPRLKERERQHGPALNHCSKCSEPCSKEVCGACALVESISASIKTIL